MAPPRDAGALLAMIGLGSPTGPLPLGLPLMSPPATAAKPLPAVNRIMTPVAPAPAPAPARAQPAPAPAVAKAASPAAPSPSLSSGAQTPVFAAPLLSHNLFSLPLPGQKKKATEPEPEVEVEEKVEEVEIVEAVVVDVPLPAEEVIDVPVPELAKLSSKQHETTTAPEPEPAPVAEEIAAVAVKAVEPEMAPAPAAVASPLLPLSPAFRSSPALGSGRPGASSRASSVSIGLGGAGGAEMPSKDVVLGMLDDEVRRARVGMDGQAVEGDEDEDEEREPLDKSVFVRGVRELLAKPGFSTALYARYLKRFAEELDQEAL